MSKKIRIFKLAKELNIASDALIEFLRNDGHEVKNINTAVDDDMYESVMQRFSAEKNLAEQKVEARRKRLIARGVLDPEEGDLPDAEKKETAEKPAILEAMATLKEIEKVEAEEKVKEKARAKKLALEEKIAKEKAEKERIKAEAEAKKRREEEKKKEAEAIKLGKGKVEKVKEDKQEVVVEAGGKQKEKPEDVKAGKTALGVPKFKKAETGPAKTVKQAPGKAVIETIDLKEIKDKSSRHKKKKTPAEIEDAAQKQRKLSKKGLGLTEKIKESQKKSIPLDQAQEEAKKGKKRKRTKKRKRVDQAEVDAAIKATLAKMDSTVKGKKYRKKIKEDDSVEEETTLLSVPEFTSVAELAKKMDVETNEVIKTCMELGLLVSINQRLDMDTIVTVADEFGFEVEELDEFSEESIVLDEIKEENLEFRPPVVTIMGHVDHGKTSLLDYIRKTNVVAGEKGGITQHIGAYEVEIGGKNITFLDTPGHEAFTAMRARGAQVTDIVILIVSAEDNVMPQTLEALNHAQAADVPIIVAINKIDKPNADPERIKKQLADHNVLIESWGGKFPSVDISAKGGTNVEELLETIIFTAELLELKADPAIKPRGVVIESRLEKGRGVACSVLVQQGTMRVGDFFVCGSFHGRVRAMFNERGKQIKSAPPATPALVLGFSGMPQAGDQFNGMISEKESKQISSRRQMLRREHDFRRAGIKSLVEFSEQVRKGKIKELAIILKGDTDGSVEALADSLMKIKTDEVEVKVIHKSIGAISEADVLLASASNAFILGFHVRPNLNAKNLAIKEEVDIRLYEVIYDAINDVKSALEGMLSPMITEEVIANVEVRDTFRVPKAGMIAGCYVLAGKVTRNDKVRLVRDGVVTYDGIINSLKRFKEDAKEVASGYECGIGIENYNDIKVGDVLETYKLNEEKREIT